MRVYRALSLVCFAGRALAQHEGHGSHGAPESPARFDFQAALVYADYNSLHADRRIGVRDWEHFQSRGFLANRLSLRAMTSLGALLPDSAGMPSLLQTGGIFERGYIHDREHSRELIMEAAAELRLSRFFVYLAPVGAPALGPEAYLHRASASSDPIAPLGHHWQDATHVSNGVATLGARAGGITLEGSAFNARESDSDQPWPNFSHARLDSYSGRVTAAAANFKLASWYGYMSHHDFVYPGMQMHRYGASASYDAPRWSSLAIWGMNLHHHDATSHALMHGDPNASPHAHSSSLLLEANVKVNAAQAIFARAERVMKNGEELGFQGGDLMALYDIRQVAIGTRRDLKRVPHAMLGAGIRGAFTFLPQTLEYTYGTRRPMGIDVFVQARGLP